jgi:hypothetical protein
MEEGTRGKVPDNNILFLAFHCAKKKGPMRNKELKALSLYLDQHNEQFFLYPSHFGINQPILLGILYYVYSVPN